MPAPAVALSGTALRHPRRTGRLLALVLVGLGLWLVFLIGALASILGVPPLPEVAGPSRVARGDIPAKYLELYRQAGARYGIDPWVLAAIGKIETDHGRLRAPGVTAGENFVGAGGPMQFLAATWASYGVDGNDDGHRDRYDPADAIPAAARYLKASGAPGDYRRAIFAYNHADWYVEQVLAQAEAYRGAATTTTGSSSPEETANVSELLTNPRLVLTPGQRADLRAGGIDTRLLATLAWIGQGHTIIVTALRKDHYPGTNHEAGRAVDIGSVDGEICRGTRTGHCARLVRELAGVTGPTRSTELIYCWDPDSADAGMFARADHCDHIHWGMDG